MSAAAPVQARRIGALLFGLAAGPVGWMGQLVLNYGLASHACFPADQPSPSPPPGGWGAEKLLLLTISLCGLALVLAGLAVSLRCWRSAGAAEAGTSRGRTRFLALCGIMTCSGFAAAIIVSAGWTFAAPGCWSFP